VKQQSSVLKTVQPGHVTYRMSLRSTVIQWLGVVITAIWIAKHSWNQDVVPFQNRRCDFNSLIYHPNNADLI